MAEKFFSRAEAQEKLAQKILEKLPLSEQRELVEEWWSLDEDDLQWGSLPPVLQKIIRANEEPVFEALSLLEYRPLLLVAISSELVGVRNDWLEQELERYGAGQVRILGKVEPMSRCPCCGYGSLHQRGEYEICKVCFWEDDGSDDEGRYSGCNHMTLQEGQSNFARFGACSERFIGKVLSDGPSRFTLMPIADPRLHPETPTERDPK